MTWCIQGNVGSPIQQPVQKPEGFEDSGAVDQPEELGHSEGQMLLLFF